MKRFLVLASALVVTLGIAAFASVRIISAVERPTSTVTDSMQLDGLTRSWMVITPASPLPPAAPIIVVLSGLAVSTSREINRDRLLAYVDAGRAELVYPVPIRESWNAGGCCGAAGTLKVDDTAFLEKLVPVIDPGHERPVYVVGYSNGGRMAYELGCTHPGLFDAMAIVKADPVAGCVVTRPQDVLVVSARDDPWVPYKPGEKGKETPPATVQIARLHKALGCPSPAATATHGDMILTSWPSCTDGKRLGWAVYSMGGHSWPPPTAHSPSGAAIIWSFLTRTALAPLPA